MEWDGENKKKDEFISSNIWNQTKVVKFQVFGGRVKVWNFKIS